MKPHVSRPQKKDTIIASTAHTTDLWSAFDLPLKGRNSKLRPSRRTTCGIEKAEDADPPRAQCLISGTLLETVRSRPLLARTNFFGFGPFPDQSNGFLYKIDNLTSSIMQFKSIISQLLFFSWILRNKSAPLFRESKALFVGVFHAVKESFTSNC